MLVASVASCVSPLKIFSESCVVDCKSLQDYLLVWFEELLLLNYLIYRFLNILKLQEVSKCNKITKYYIVHEHFKHEVSTETTN